MKANPKLAAKLQALLEGHVINTALTSTNGTARFVLRDNPEGGSIAAHPVDKGKVKSRVVMV